MTVAEITLVRIDDMAISDADKEAARRVMFGKVDGLGEKGKRQWRRFLNDLFKLEPGEVMTIKTHKARSGPFHRRHMKMEQVVFESQERFDNFDKGFRDWLKVGAGHCDWHPGPKGGVFPVPKSISYADMEEHEMREFHMEAVKFLRTPHALKTLWPHLPEAQRVEMIETVLGGFGE
jgi:hypothetical protein